MTDDLQDATASSSELGYERELTVRFRDLDIMGHVNNAVYASYLEHARTSYVDDVIGNPPEDIGMVVANLEIDFDRSITFRESVTVAMGVTEIGTSSMQMAYEVRTEAGIAATATTTIVTLDEGGRPQPVPDRMRAAVAEYEGL